jgi:glucose/arabinose dehydrogenase
MNQRTLAMAAIPQLKNLPTPTTRNGLAYVQCVKDPNLAVESFVDGLNSPTSVAFLDNENIFVLEKEG